jgi:hypothetical protein
MNIKKLLQERTLCGDDYCSLETVDVTRKIGPNREVSLQRVEVLSAPIGHERIDRMHRHQGI